MLLYLVVIACLLQLIESSNLVNANNSVCTISCTTCTSDTTSFLTVYNHTFIMDLLNTAISNGQAIKEAKEAVDDITRSQSLIKNTIATNAGAINDILLLVKDLVALVNDSIDISRLPTSCQEIKDKQSNSPSGMYLIVIGNDETKYVYCNMEDMCGSGGGWTRLAYLDMSNATQNCPSGFRLYQSGGVRACGRPVTNSGGCASVTFPSNGISYSQVCGRVIGYQYGSSDALDTTNGNHNNLNGPYVDGVSITHGSPRQLIWTLIASWADSYCPCSTGGGFPVQSFVGNNYFCESSNPGVPYFLRTLYTSDPLWDGKKCHSSETACCSGLPWFHRDYGSNTTTDYIELRVCGDEGTYNEDAPVAYYEIYVK